MELLYAIASYYLLICVLLVFFPAVMTLDRANIALTLPFLDLPAELTVSERLTRYKQQGSGWRCRAAVWFALHFLGPFDRRGNHM